MANYPDWVMKYKKKGLISIKSEININFPLPSVPALPISIPFQKNIPLTGAIHYGKNKPHHC